MSEAANVDRLTGVNVEKTLHLLGLRAFEGQRALTESHRVYKRVSAVLQDRSASRF